jgi:hypothetical protein
MPDTIHAALIDRMGSRDEHDACQSIPPILCHRHASPLGDLLNAPAWAWRVAQPARRERC